MLPSALPQRHARYRRGFGTLARRSCSLALLCLLAGACAAPATFESVSERGLRTRLDVWPLQARGPCADRFVAHPLDFVTEVNERPVRMFASNGSGLGINDLDQDGRLDLVLANLDGPNAIMWNEGDLRFRREDLPTRGTRSVSLVDVDGDGWLDIVFALRRFLPVVHYSRQGARAFERELLSLFPDRTYTLAWADLDADGDLDSIAATYDAERVKDEGIMAPAGGVFAMYQKGLTGTFSREQLAIRAQALAILLEDLNADDRLDVVVGHDFELPDQTWLRTDEGWQAARVFPEITRNTMSFAAGDLDNDGVGELFAADMKPFKDDPATLAQWQPLVEKMDFPVTEGQVMHNALQVKTADGYENQAAAQALLATGWTWSAQFGDLDNDGLLDLYVVNGMQAQEMFSHLPEAELVEENLAFRNAGAAGFQWMADWGLASTDGGRSMGMADLDLDGDLDIVVNNLLAPAVVFENRLCGGQALELDLRWPGSGNTHALGAEAVLWTDQGLLTRAVRSNSGYLTGEAARLHFGVPAGASLERLEVRWPDGRTTSLPSLAPQVRLRLTRLD